MEKSLILPLSELLSLDAGYSEEECIEIRRVAFLYLYQSGQIDHVASIKAEQLSAAKTFGRLALDAAKVAGKKVTLLRSLKAVNMLLRKVTGMDQIKEWLSKNRGETILNMSGRMGAFESMWHFNQEILRLFPSIDSLKEAVSDHWAWFKVLKLIISNPSVEESEVLFKSGKWNQRKMTFNLLIAVTLKRPFKRFARKELESFIAIVSDHAAWTKTLPEAMRGFIEDKALADSISNSPSFLKIVAELDKKSNRSILSLGRWIDWDRGNNGSFRQALAVFEASVRYARKDKKAKGKKSATDIEAIADFNDRLFRLKTKSLLEVAGGYPFLSFWMDEKALLRVAVFAAEDDPLRKALEVAENAAWKKINAALPVKMTMEKVLLSFWNQKAIAGIDFHEHLHQFQNDQSSAREETKLRRLGLYEYAKNLLETTVLKAPLPVLKEWLKLFHQSGFAIAAGLVSPKLLVGLYLSEGKLPRSVVESVQALDVFKWIDGEETAAYFDAYVSRTISIITEGRPNEKGHTEGRVTLLHTEESDTDE